METNPALRGARVRRSSRLGALAVLSTLALLVAPAGAQDGTRTEACDDVVAYVRGQLGGRVLSLTRESGFGYRDQETSLESRLRATSHGRTQAYRALVTAACRAETRRGAAPAATAAARALAERRDPGAIDLGRILLCAMQDPASLGEVAAWMDVSPPDVRAVCVSELATWTGAEGMRGAILARSIRRPVVGWEVDPAVVAAANTMNTPELRAQLAPVLTAAYAHRATGYDRLRDGLCTCDEPMSGELADACSTLPADAEAEWPQRESARRWLVKGAATAIFVGATTAAIVERHEETGRLIATGAGIPMGALIGLGVGSIGTSGRERLSTGRKIELVGGALIGGALGGLAAHQSSASPGARGPVTALGLAPFYFATVLMVSID